MRSALPKGGELPVEEWERRHRALTRLLWATAVAVAGYSALQGYAVWHTALDGASVVVAGLVAARTGLGRRVRSLACSFGLLTAAAMAVHVSGGVTEAHFSFFVVVVLLTLYEDWTVFVLAVVYTLVHHGVLGMIDPGEVFAAHPGDPWKWAAIHAVFVAAGGAAGVVAWRLNEDVRHRMRRTQDDLRQALADRDQIELELRLAQKLEAVGQLAAGIAHEINTPIQFVGDTSRFLNEAFADLMPLLDRYAEVASAARAGDVPAELLERVAAAAELADLDYLRERVPAACERTLAGIGHVGEIVSAMRTFAHPATGKAPVDVNEAIRNTLIVTANEYKYAADMHTDLAELPPVVCSASDLNQVLINLVVNAAHAVIDLAGDAGERGRIEIRTRPEPDGVLIVVADSGCGIPADVADRIFDPFFTTKAVGRGSGQGLAIARTIVTERHGGSISFTTEPGRGTTFEVRLPIGDLSGTQAPDLAALAA